MTQIPPSSDGFAILRLPFGEPRPWEGLGRNHAHLQTEPTSPEARRRRLSAFPPWERRYNPRSDIDTVWHPIRLGRPDPPPPRRPEPRPPARSLPWLLVS